MKLVGVELKNYAKFDRCFVPLDTGVRLIVGKNNSGKTSILRALSTLTALPFGGARPIATEVAGYLRNLTPSPSFEMDILFAFEGKDAQYLGANLEGWPPFGKSQQRTWIFSFIVLPQDSYLGLTGARLQCDETSFVVIEANTTTAIWRRRDAQGNAAGGQQLRLAQAGSTTSGGIARNIFVADELLAELPSLMATRFVHAHRVVRPNLNLQALDVLSDTADALAPYLDTFAEQRPGTLSTNRENRN